MWRYTQHRATLYTDLLARCLQQYLPSFLLFSFSLAFKLPPLVSSRRQPSHHFHGRITTLNCASAKAMHHHHPTFLHKFYCSPERHSLYSRSQSQLHFTNSPHVYRGNGPKIAQRPSIRTRITTALFFLFFFFFLYLSSNLFAIDENPCQRTKSRFYSLEVFFISSLNNWISLTRPHQFPLASKIRHIFPSPHESSVKKSIGMGSMNKDSTDKKIIA